MLVMELVVRWLRIGESPSDSLERTRVLSYRTRHLRVPFSSKLDCHLSGMRNERTLLAALERL